MRRHWLDWCRLCANDIATIDVRKKDAYKKIISKVFDVEIGQEEPALGAMLCNECYSLVDDLIHFVDNVNKVQPIFELLRHSEPNEHLNVRALRHQYGLSTRYKAEPSEVEILNSRDKSMELDIPDFMDDDISQADSSYSTPPTPAKRKRGRPKSSKKLNNSVDRTDEHEVITPNFPTEHCKEELSIKVQVEALSNSDEGVEEELVENHIWLEDYPMEDNEQTLKNALKRKRKQRKEYLKIERAISPDDFDALSENYSLKSATEMDKLKFDPANYKESETHEISNTEETAHIPITRKRGRPKKNQVHIQDEENLNESNLSKCKNVALARLLSASPHSENSVDDKQNKKRPVTCNICNKELANENSLKQHEERVHMKKKPVVCDSCGKRVSNFSELKEHMLVHTEERPFACPVCNASFKNQKRLKIHSQSHGTPKYECEICGKKLQTRAIWNKHKYVHTNERRFKCSICGTAVKNSTALKVHLLSHTGLRPYACKYCNKAFASGVNCRDHKIKKHPEEFAKDDDKSSRIQSVPTLDELRAL
ncbi:zinc finger protein weckle-like isoform X2 [Drosophila innubila]|nr:zinc finger protein weckle-like isoform X2 [Drosophila innubila]